MHKQDLLLSEQTKIFFDEGQIFLIKILIHNLKQDRPNDLISERKCASDKVYISEDRNICFVV